MQPLELTVTDIQATRSLVITNCSLTDLHKQSFGNQRIRKYITTNKRACIEMW